MSRRVGRGRRNLSPRISAKDVCRKLETLTGLAIGPTGSREPNNEAICMGGSFFWGGGPLVGRF